MEIIENVTDDIIQSKYLEICDNLNLPSDKITKSFEVYQIVRKDYDLKGNQIHWLCCSLYVTCRRSESVPNQVNVSLTKLLRNCNITFYEFFKNMKQWTQMIQSSSDFKNFINNLSNSLSVSLLVYEKFGIIFKDLFIEGEETTGRKVMKRNSKVMLCTPQNLYTFCWYLFICVKSDYPENTVDLVTSIHMLFCCLELVYANAIASKRTDLVNPKFEGVSENWAMSITTGDQEPINHPVCIMKILCEKHEGTIVDAMTTKTYGWKEVINKYFETGVLIGDETKFLNLLLPENFDTNLKSLRKLYEEYVLNIGEIDEGIFLAQTKISDQDMIERTRSLIQPETPLTGRNYLPGRESTYQTTVAIATQSVQRLRTHLTTYSSSAPTTLMELFSLCRENPIKNIENILTAMSDTFQRNFEVNANDRFNLAKNVYYRLLENILKSEITLNKPNFDLKILNVDIFHQTLFACSVEIVIYAYRSLKPFPWILHCFQLDALNFYKVIEPVVLYHGDILTRDIIKHLNAIEEQCLESLAWKSTSPIWKIIAESKDQLPKMQSVDWPLQNNNSNNNNNNINGNINNKNNTNHHRDLLQSPVTSASDRFSSITLNVPTTSSSGAVKVSQCNNNFENNSNNNDTKNNVTSKNRGSGAIKLFFRKFYKLAFLRISELFKDLKLHEQEHLQKIWTIFEYSIVEQINLMRNRHLDQIIMCATYLFARVSRSDIKFKDIMFSYRAQPKCTQTRSHIYREVLINPDDEINDSNKKDIITFYNQVYVQPQEMQNFAMRFSQNSTESLILSPLPANQKNKLLSPMKVSENRQIFIHAMEPRDFLTSPGAAVYLLNNSPRKQELNSNGKRKLPFNGDSNEQLATKVNRVYGRQQVIATPNKRLENLIADRQENTSEK